MVVTVCAVTEGGPVGFITQRKLFYAKGLHWLFYHDGSNFVYRTSSDGIVWSDSAVVRTGGSVSAYSVVYDDGDYVHIAYADGASLYYRRGKLASDGTITWDDWRNTGLNPSLYPVIALDSDGYPWVGVKYVTGGVHYPYVTKSSTKDGTWTTDSGFPYQLSATLTGDWAYAVPVALTGGKVYVLYGTGGAKVRGKLYDAGWGAEETASSSTINDLYISAATYEDEVKVVFLHRTDSTYYLYYIERDSTGNWSSEVKLSTGYMTARVCVDQDNGDVYVFWAYNGVIYLQRKMHGTWDTSYLEWITGEGDFPPVNSERLCNINTFIKKYGRSIGVAWGRGTSSPYDLRFAPYIILPTSLKSNSHNI
jgi:hypothetical protein